MFVDMPTGQEIDLDELLNVSCIQNIINDSEYFYLFANKRNNKLGYYLFRLKINKPNEYETLINWNNKLDVADSSLQIMEDFKPGRNGK